MITAGLMLQLVRIERWDPASRFLARRKIKVGRTGSEEGTRPCPKISLTTVLPSLPPEP